MTATAWAARVASWCLAVALVTAPREAGAWLFHEHGVITTEGARRLDPRHLNALQSMWTLARGGQTPLCANVADAWSGDGRCVSFGALPSIAGDHSCSPTDLDRVLRQPWALRVVAAASELSRRTVPDTADDDVATRLELRREHDRQLLLLDEDFLSRASSNVSHFDLARRADDLEAYLGGALSPHEALNAQGLYAMFHAAALYEAAQAHVCATAPTSDAGAPCDAGAAMWRAFLAEVYALHFLEDSFSAGHTAGAWGDSAQRAGTHDHYCMSGVDASLWGAGDRHEVYAAYGDGFLTEPDIRHASAAVGESLSQFACAYDSTPAACRDYRDALGAVVAQHLAATVSTCDAVTMPQGVAALATRPVFSLFASVLALAPRPARLRPEVPRFSNELGLFFGLSAHIQGNAMWPGDDFVPAPRAYTAGTLVFGVNAAGMLSRYVDGMLYAGVGVATGFSPEGPRTGIRLHVRSPLAPWDLVAWAARSLFGSSTAAAVFFDSLAGGAMIPGLQRYHIVSPYWTWQFALGREAWFTWFLGERTEFHWSLPVFNLRGQNEYLGRLGTDLIFSLGLEGASLGADGFSFGVFISASPTGRFYLRGGV